MPQATVQQPCTELLWAYQIKREHAFLLSRVKDVEALAAKHEQQIKDKEANANAAQSEEVAKLAQQVQKLSSLSSFSTNGLHRELRDQMENIQTEHEALTVMVSKLDSISAKGEEERKIGRQDQMTILKRIAELDTNLTRYVTSLENLHGQVNDQQADSIATVVDSLRKEVEESGAQVNHVSAKLDALQHANDLLTAGIKRNERDLRDMQVELAATRAEKNRKDNAREASRTRPGLQAKKKIPQTHAPKSNPRTAHKKVTRGSPPQAVVKSRRGRPPVHRPATVDKKAPSKLKTPVHKPAARQLSKNEADNYETPQDRDGPVDFLVRKDGTTERPKGTACKPCAKAHKRCIHGFTDTDLQASQKRNLKGFTKPVSTTRPPRPPPKSLSPVVPKAKPVPKPRVKKDRGFQSDKPILRQGKGWLEILESPNDSEESEDEEGDEDEVVDQASAPRMRKRKSEAERLISEAKRANISVGEPSRKRRRLDNEGNADTSNVRDRDADRPVKRPRGRPRKPPQVDSNDHDDQDVAATRETPQGHEHQSDVLDMPRSKFPMWIWTTT